MCYSGLVLLATTASNKILLTVQYNTQYNPPVLGALLYIIYLIWYSYQIKYQSSDGLSGSYCISHSPFSVSWLIPLIISSHIMMFIWGHASLMALATLVTWLRKSCSTVCPGEASHSLDSSPSPRMYTLRRWRRGQKTHCWMTHSFLTLSVLKILVLPHLLQCVVS